VEVKKIGFLLMVLVLSFWVVAIEPNDNTDGTTRNSTGGTAILRVQNQSSATGEQVIIFR